MNWDRACSVFTASCTPEIWFSVEAGLFLLA